MRTRREDNPANNPFGPRGEQCTATRSCTRPGWNGFDRALADVGRQRALSAGSVLLQDSPLASALCSVAVPSGEEGLLRSSLDALDEAIFRMSAVRDAAGRIVDFEYAYCNRAALRVLGRPGHEVLGRRLLELFPSHRTNGLFDAYARVTETGEPLRREFAFA